jgi:hypothetical protein
MPIRLVLLSAPPEMHASASPRPITRIDSPIESRLDASAHVIVFDGPWQSWMIVTWQASMFGRYLSIQSGVRFFIPSPPQAPKSKDPSAARAVTSADASSFSSAAISPAPMWQPKRPGGIVTSPASCALVRRPASSIACIAAPTASSMSRAITLVALR